MTNFIDKTKIYVCSGTGGNGIVHLRREAHMPMGGPDGGDGGHGGDIIFEVNPHLNTLFKFRHQRQFRGEKGANGGTNNKTGRSAPHLIIPVPPGTVIYDDATGEILGDLTEVGQQLTICKGGRGGRGNKRFANSRNKTPRVAERGAPGEERDLRLELKLIADVGLIGVPNAGKSTLLSVATNATPKIAAYPFTTLVPNLGVAQLDYETSLVLADIPGLIEGAHEGVGLGHDFLRHIQRTRVLIHLLDGLAEDPLADFTQINSELALFDPELGQKPQIVVFNKMDLPEVQERWPEIKAHLTKRDYTPMNISAVANTNVRELLYRAVQLLEENPLPPPTAEIPVYRVETDPRAFTIEREDGGWRVHGKSIERAAAMTYWEHWQSIRRFQRILETLGIDEALRDAGVQPGETVYIGKYELEWED